MFAAPSLRQGPVTATWLALLGATGIYNIVSYPAIWRAYDPSRAILWFVRTGSYDNLAGVLLAITGCEAMFANLGQFNKAAIRISFAGYAYPMLVLAYLVSYESGWTKGIVKAEGMQGQGARLIQETTHRQVSHLTIPGPTGGGLYWIMFTFAVLATVSRLCHAFVAAETPASSSRLKVRISWHQESCHD